MSADLFLVAASHIRAGMFDPGAQETMVRDAADLRPVVTLADVLKRLDDLETPPAVVQELATCLAEATEDTELEDGWVADLVRRHARAVEVEQFRIALRNASRSFGALREKQGGIQWGFDLLADPAARLIGRLKALVAKLPEGEDALRPEANIDAGTSAELGEVRDILKRLGTIVGYLASQPVHGFSGELLLVLDTPDVEVGTAVRGGNAEINPSPARQALKSLRGSDAPGSDYRVVGLARGDYAPLGLRLAANPAEVRRRVEQVANSRLVEFVSRTAANRPGLIRPALEAS